MSDTNVKLFSDELISAKVQAALPQGYLLRPLQRNDYRNGHLAVLEDLAYIGEITEAAWTERFDFMRSCQGTYYIVVIEDASRGKGKGLVATATLVAEKKFLCQLGTQGHIEDVAVIKDQQGQRLGVRLLAALDHVAEKVGCYKVILDCSPHNEGFYEKCKYKKAGSEMHQYFDSLAKDKGV